MMFLYICIAICSKFRFMLNDGVTYMRGSDGMKVETTIKREEADIFELRYNSATDGYMNIVVTNKGDLYWDIAANKTDLHYWKNNNMEEKQYFRLVYLPNDDVGVINANGMCLEYKENVFQRASCNFLNQTNQRFKMERLDEIYSEKDRLSREGNIYNTSTSDLRATSLPDLRATSSADLRGTSLPDLRGTSPLDRYDSATRHYKFRREYYSH